MSLLLYILRRNRLKSFNGIIVHPMRDNAFLSVQDMLKTNPTAYY